LKNRKIVLTGGGTGGHVFPALAMAEELKKRGYELRYVGSQRGMEARLVPQSGIPFFTVQTGAVKNQKIFTIIKTCFKLIGAILWSITFLRKEKPDAVIGVGGYISFPISFAAFILRIPLFLQEQNVSVGITNRVLGRMAQKVFLGFEEAESYFPNSKIVVTGNPIRQAFYSDSAREYQSTPPQLLIFGGSQGAHAINDVILNFLDEIQTKYPSISIYHQTGEKDLERVKKVYQEKLKLPYQVVPFIENMVEAYSKASLVICRSGALTVSELIQIGRPSLLIPFPRKGQNDQTANAYWLESLGCAGVVEQGDKFKERFWEVLQEKSSGEKLKEMSKNLATLKQKPSSDLIVRDISEAIECTKR
jgi:UDP-N-acetylglucosamine--N-acetylmuramyl-(pentapeptide) pyrophosphoryl-undecaprenol N-acetylglucosamine transferase